MAAQKSTGQRGTRSERTLRVVAFLAFVVIGVVMALNFPSSAPIKKNPSYLDNIFASRIALFGARLLLVEGALFLVCSLAVRTLRGDWATKAVGVDTDTSSDLDAAGDAVDELASWKGRAKTAEDKVEALEDRLRATEGDLKAVLTDLETAEAKLAAQTRNEGSAGENS